MYVLPPGKASNEEPDVTVIGGGIAGLTSAARLGLMGADVQLKAEHLAYKENRDKGELTLATPAAPGNIEAVNVGADDKSGKKEFQLTQELYRNTLSEYQGDETPPIVQNPFFFGSEEGGDAPSELPYQDVFDHTWNKTIAEFRNDPGFPAVPSTQRMDDNQELLCYEAFGVDNRFLDILKDALYQVDVKIEETSVDLEQATEQQPGIVVNCAGLNGPKVAGKDPADEISPVLGHLVHIDVEGSKTPGVEYALTPHPDDVKTHEVYMFERGNGEIIVGGSHVEIEEPWPNNLTNVDVPFETAPIAGIEVPTYIGNNNAEIFENMADTAVDDKISESLYSIAELLYDAADGALEGGHPDVDVIVGARPTREGGTNIGFEKVNGEDVYQNYGHGPAGWSRAPGVAANMVAHFMLKGHDFGEQRATGGNPLLEAYKSLDDKAVGIYRDN